MSAVVCGKRSLFEDLYSSPPSAKRIRCGGGSPIRFSSLSPPPRSSPTGASEAAGTSETSAHYICPPVEQQEPLSRLRQLFPDMDGQLLERVLEACGSNLDSAIKSLSDLQLGSNERSSSKVDHLDNASVSRPDAEQSSPAVTGRPGSGNHAESTSPRVPADGREWVELVVGEMMNATDLDDARARATRALEAFEKAVTSRSTELLQKENAAFREQLQALCRDNQILKRACIIQHERQVEHENRARELEQLKQMCSKYQEQLRNLEMNNYALSLHLRKAQEGGSIPGRFHPDVF